MSEQQDQGVEFGSKHYEWILNRIDIGVHLINQDGMTLFYNEKMADIDGLKREQVIGNKLFHLYPSLTEETSTLVQVLQTGKETGEKVQTYVNLQGKRITTINRTFPLYESGKLIGALEVAKDITSIVHLHDQILDLRNQIHQSHIKDKKPAGSARYHFNDIIGISEPSLEAISIAKKASRTNSPILLSGPTGTGKELFAQSIHNAGIRKTRPFIAQNCAAVPSELLEGLMFGTARGAFTGAIDRAGLFEQAHGGTLFLDELNSLGLFLQAKLLRVLQDGIVRRIGGASEQQVDVRIIAAINIDPKDALDKGIIRSDLFYRINVVNIALPPLKERKEDIPILAQHFIEKMNPAFGMRVSTVHPDVMERFMEHEWPGNIRELNHVIESTYNMMELECEMIEEQHLPTFLKKGQSPKDAGTLTDRVKLLELKAIESALKQHNYNISLAAQELGIKRQALQYKLKSYGISKK